jgi:SAM-dependent methyltransferase
VGNFINRISLFVAQLLFSVITPPLLMPRIAKLKFTRSFIAFCFGRAYGTRYQEIIDSFQGRYGLAMAVGLKKAKSILGNKLSVVADCGTGTGFVTKQAAALFPDATYIAFDILMGMLKQARSNCQGLVKKVFYVKADNFTLPLADESIDLILVQNTMPFFEEFARVCRPGGVIVYVDVSSGWVAERAKILVEKSHLFKKVVGERVDMGFCILAEKASGTN